MFETAMALNALMELRDSYTARHQWRVAQLSCELAAEWGLPESCREALKAAALMHDIGKMAVPMQILNKPDRLAEHELNLIKTHPQVAYNALMSLNLPWPVPNIVLQHHELLDASGYPYGLVDNEILTEAKILTVANVMEAITSFVPYRKVRNSIDEALEEIVRHKGIKYDPQVVDACVILFTKKDFIFNDNGLLI